MSIGKVEKIKKYNGRGIVSSKVRSHANDSFLVKKVAEAKET